MGLWSARSVTMPTTWIALDDTDSYEGGCTTWVAYQTIKKFALSLADFPALIRLNPEIPWKTRGNGAVLIMAKKCSTDDENIARFILSETQFGGKTSPGVFITGDKPIGTMWRRALTDVVTPRVLQLELKNLEGRPFCRNGHARGLIGAISAAEHVWDDFTFELISYRETDLPRVEEPRGVLWMDSLTSPLTFLNYDRKANKPLIYPSGPDPVWFGIRGEDPLLLIGAYHLVSNYPENPWMVFKTNQGTNEHVVEKPSIMDAHPYTTVKLTASVEDQPRMIQGGHLLVKLTDPQGNTFQAIAYRQTGELVKKAALLRRGDRIQVWGAIQPKIEKAINLQGLLFIAGNALERKAPWCPICGHAMEKKGQHEYRCKPCGTTAHDEQTEVIPRPKPESEFLPSASAFKHLMKPYRRHKLDIHYEFNEDAYEGPSKMLNK